MGDYFQTIVDRDASLAEAEQLAKKIRKMLIERGIIVNLPTKCVLSGTGFGYEPGSRYEQAFEGLDPYPGTRQLRTNGLGTIAKRSVFDSGQGGVHVSCPCCQTQIDLQACWSAIDEWWNDATKGLLECSSCHYIECVTEWKFDPNWGFGNLGLEFWNWPPLKESFIAEIQQYLGHQIVFVSGKV